MAENHYKKLPIEPIDIMKASFTQQEFIGFCKGNIIKYVLRQKGNYRSDIKKARAYCDYLIEELDNPNSRIMDDQEYKANMKA